MRYERLGRTDMEVSKIGLGTWQFGSFYWGWGREINEEIAIELVRTAVEELGINLIDTAEIYGNGKSERIIGRAMRDLDRDRVVIATKLFPFPWRITPRRAIRALEGSLGRLGVDRIDLYQIHWPSPIFPLRGVLRELEREVDEGRIRAIGVSNFSLRQLERARSYMRKHDIASNQVEYNLLRRKVERELIPYCQREGITVIAYSPLAQGLLTGKYGPGRMPGGLQRRMMMSLFFGYGGVSWDPVGRVRELAEKKGVRPAQIALAWLISKPGVVAIPGAKNPDQLRSNAGAAGIELSEEELMFLEGGVVP